jgi:DNA repair protein RadC
MMLRVVTQGKPFRNVFINSEVDVYPIMSFLATADREMLYVLHLDSRNGLIAKEGIAMGALNMAHAPIREIFKGAILNNSKAIILVHNHPSGDETPSLNDVILTGKAKDAGTLHGIQVMDSVIIAGMRSMSIISITEAQWFKRYNKVPRPEASPPKHAAGVADGPRISRPKRPTSAAARLDRIERDLKRLDELMKRRQTKCAMSMAD